MDKLSMQFDLRFRNHGYIKRIKVILCSLEKKFESVSTSNHMFGTAMNCLSAFLKILKLPE